MMNRWTHIGKQGAAVVMLLLFACYYVDVNFFVHRHVINGVTVVHSHIHNQHHHDTDAGGHSATELTLIANMATQFLTTGETPLTELTAFDTLILTLGVEQNSEVVSTHLLTHSLRAPPASCSTPRS